jgi:hypothetical protein
MAKKRYKSLQESIKEAKKRNDPEEMKKVKELLETDIFEGMGSDGNPPTPAPIQKYKKHKSTLKYEDDENPETRVSLPGDHKKIDSNLPKDIQTDILAINVLNTTVIKYMIKTCKVCIDIGERLVNLKEKLYQAGYKNWEEFAQKNLEFSDRQADRYIQIFSNKHILIPLIEEFEKVGAFPSQRFLTNIIKIHQKLAFEDTLTNEEREKIKDKRKQDRLAKLRIKKNTELETIAAGYKHKILDNNSVDALINSWNSKNPKCFISQEEINEKIESKEMKEYRNNDTSKKSVLFLININNYHKYQAAGGVDKDIEKVIDDTISDYLKIGNQCYQKNKVYKDRDKEIELICKLFEDNVISSSDLPALCNRFNILNNTDSLSPERFSENWLGGTGFSVNIQVNEDFWDKYIYQKKNIRDLENYVDNYLKKETNSYTFGDYLDNLDNEEIKNSKKKVKKKVKRKVEKNE